MSTSFGNSKTERKGGGGYCRKFYGFEGFPIPSVVIEVAFWSERIRLAVLNFALPLFSCSVSYFVSPDRGVLAGLVLLPSNVSYRPSVMSGVFNLLRLVIIQFFSPAAFAPDTDRFACVITLRKLYGEW